MDTRAARQAQPEWRLRLYIAGDTPHSKMALNNLEAILKKLPGDRHQVEIVDILKQPLRMIEDGIVVTPTLIKLAPEPTCQLMGNLSDHERVLLALDLSDARDG